MELSTSDGAMSNNESLLEKALNGILFIPDITFNYTFQDKKVSTNAYIVPLDAHNQTVYGYFMINNFYSGIPIGLSVKKDFLSKDYYHFNANGTVTEGVTSYPRTLYMPLNLLGDDILIDVGTKKNNKWESKEGSPFRIYGFNGSQGLKPIFFVSETEQKIMCMGAYKFNDGKLATYSHGILQADYGVLRSFINTGSKDKNSQNIELHKKQSSKSRIQIITPKTISTEFTEKIETKSIDNEIDWQEPKSIVSYLDQYIIGQDDAKRVIAVTFSNYITKMNTNDDSLQKDNILLIGPSGVGKTYMISLLAKKASVPMVQSKLTGKSTEGYKGENLSAVLEQIRTMTTGNMPYGIVFLDEIDKLSQASNDKSGFGLNLQDELIGWLEEASIFADKKNDSKEYTGLNTKNLLFVTAGAFQSTDSNSSLEGIIKKRLGTEKIQMGFTTQENAMNNTNEYALSKLRPEDLINYGLKPELVGRLASLAVCTPLTDDDKVKILTNAKRSVLNNYKQLLSLKGYTLELAPEVPKLIVSYCPEDTGARAINAVCNDLFTEILFDPKQYADSNKLIKITPELTRKLINLYS